MSENFNYISFGGREYVADIEEDFAMHRGRMFEYTPTDIEKRVEDLGPIAVEFIEKLPTFLCSEIERSSKAVSMIIRFGRVRKILVDKREVSAVFDSLLDFGEVEFSDIAQAKDVFGADGFQLYRTHWAIRDGDAREVLERLVLLHPEFSDAIMRYLTSSDEIQAEPPPREKNIIGTADSVEAFLQHLCALPSDPLAEYFFRGHEDPIFEFTPSLLRKLPSGDWQYLINEDRLGKELLIAHYDEFQSDHFCFDRLVRMQHYGLPTRLLDISSNPLVALFFACYANGNVSTGDGEVITFKIKSDKIKYYDSDTVSCISNLSNLSYLQKSDINLSLDDRAFNKLDVAEKLLHHIRSEKGYFEGRIVPDDLGSIVCVKAKRTNTRIRSQSGAFLLFGHEATLSEAGDDSIEVKRVTVTNKVRILKELESINISATTVYPSIEQTAVHLRNHYQPK